MFDVVKIANGYYVTDHRGELLIGYKSKATADKVCRNHILAAFAAAEIENDRRESIATYLTTRAARVSAQLEMEF